MFLLISFHEFVPSYLHYIHLATSQMLPEVYLIKLSMHASYYSSKYWDLEILRKVGSYQKIFYSSNPNLIISDSFIKFTIFWMVVLVC